MVVDIDLMVQNWAIPGLFFFVLFVICSDVT